MESKKIISLNPGNNYEKVGEIPSSTHKEVDQAVAQARNAQAAWAALGFNGRIALLNAVYDTFNKRKKEISMLAAQEMGMPISISEKIDIEAGLQYMKGYLEFAPTWLAPETVFENDTELHQLFFEPKGVCASSIPWNFPFCNFVWGVMQNLVVGNTVVLKHSEECPLSAKLIQEILEATNLPKGVCTQVYGEGADVGEYLMNNNIDLIYFTGSTGVGKHLYQLAAKKFIPAILELGGSAPGIVFKDADIPATIESIYFNRYVNSGQTCDGLKRLIVHHNLFDEVVDKLKKLIATKKIGNPTDPSTDVGPLVAERQLTTCEEQVKDALEKGAQIICGGRRPGNLKGAYYEPTIMININPNMRVWKEEVFAPVLPIVTFETEQQAIDLANDTQYGLGGYIYTQDKERAQRVCAQLRTGNISVNGANYVIAQGVFGGYKNSGLGREHGKYGIREFCNAKLVAFKK